MIKHNTTNIVLKQKVLHQGVVMLLAFVLALVVGLLIGVSQVGASGENCNENELCEPENGENNETCPIDCPADEGGGDDEEEGDEEGGDTSDDSEASPVGASIWLSAVCEPNDGFSDDGNLTMNTDALDKGLDAVVYVGASVDGPWTALAVNGPPYVFTRETMEALAGSEGVASYSDLWFWMGSGQAINLGTAIAGREGNMDSLCLTGELTGAAGANSGPITLAVAFAILVAFAGGGFLIMRKRQTV